MHHISPVYARCVLRELLRRDVPAAALFDRTSLDREILETGGDISVGDFATFLRNARKVSGDEKLGLMIGAQSNVVTLGAMGTAAVVAPTVRSGFQMMENFSRLHASYVKVESISTVQGLSIRLTFLEDLGEVEKFHAEASIMIFQSYLEMLTGIQVNDAEYRFAFDQPPYASEYPKWLHSRASFGARQTSIELPSHWLERRSPFYNEDLWRQSHKALSQRMRELADREEQPYTAHITAYLRSCEPPLPDLAFVAKQLYMSTRTLNRRLQIENSSFRELKSQVLRRWANEYLLTTDNSVENIAAALGYQDTANFRRAFRVWEDCTPRQFKERKKSRNAI
ncbi:MAG: AraC family transcriptional regulator ligand-binding domain-containing protein [Halioglobus sp.]